MDTVASSNNSPYRRKEIITFLCYSKQHRENHMSRAMRKCVLCHMGTTKAQSDQRLCFRCLDSIIYVDAIAEISRT